MSTSSARDHASASGAAAANYERYLVACLFRPCADVLLDTAVVEPGAVVLDVAAGTGVVSRAAARRSGPCGRDRHQPVDDRLRRSAADRGGCRSD